MSQGALARLFAGSAVVTEEAALPAVAPTLDPAEEQQVARVVPNRRVEYATGRRLAHTAMARLGVPPAPLLNDERRAPCWPTGVRGSITHTGAVPGGYCGVAVARASDVRALGIDAEESRPLEEELWRLLFTPGERAVLASLPPEARGHAALLRFSAKEAYYKAQYPLTGMLLGFTDVEVEVDPPSASFVARLRVNLDGHPLPVVGGRYFAGDTLVVTAVVEAA